jgi:very-short-patch-repair endonuclease
MGHAQTAVQKVTFGDRLIRLVFAWRRWHRLFFPSPAEVKFVRLMGGHALPLGMRSRHSGFMLTIVWRGQTLKRHGFKREVRYGRYYVDMANDVNWIIEVDGYDWHMDAAADRYREVRLEALTAKPYGMRVLRIKAARLWNEPDKVRRDVLRFIST